jgi:hypothetical protein
VVVPYSEVGNSKKSFSKRIGAIFSTAKIVKLSRNKLAEVSKELDQSCNAIQVGLQSLGLNAQRLDTQALIELYYNSYNPDLFQKQPLENINKLNIEADV